MLQRDRLSMERSSEIMSAEAKLLLDDHNRKDEGFYDETREELDGGVDVIWAGLRDSRNSRQSRNSSSLLRDISLKKSLLEEENSMDQSFSLEREKFLDPYSPENRGIFASYLAVGFGLYFFITPLSYYMVDDLDSSASQQSIVLGLQSLPWALKMMCGFLTDSVPIGGLRRKPYFLIGWLCYALSNIALTLLVKPNIAMLAVFVFLQTMSFVQADVCTDAMLVERSRKYEDDSNRGGLQATAYIIRFFGAIIGAALGAVLYNKDEWGWGVPIWGIFLINAVVPISLICPFFYTLVEVKSEEPPKIREQLASIWTLVQRKAVWTPCTFIFIYNMLLLTNPAWNTFLVDGLGFTNFLLGLLTLVGTILSFCGLVLYKKYLSKTSWRTVYIFCTCVSALFTLLQLVLVLRWNKSLDMESRGLELIFAMGSYGVIQFVVAVQFLPCCRMFLVMCPEGAEGASYAMLTTLSNLAGTLAYSIAAGMALIWDVSSDTIEEGNWNGMWKLTLLVGSIQLTGLFFLPLLPKSMEEQLALQKSDVKSRFAGQMFIGVICFTLLIIIAFTVYTIIG